MSTLQKFISSLIAILVIIFLLNGLIGWVSGKWGLVIISSQELGVRYTFGKIADQPKREGLHFVLPFVQKIEKVDMRERKTTIKTQTVSKEGLQFYIDITVRYRVKDAVNLVKNLQTPLNELIASYANATIDDVASGKDKNELYSDKGRMAIVKAVREKLNTELEGYAIIGQVIFENIRLPSSITEAIQAQQAALEKIKEKENMKQVAKKEAEIRKIEARGIADANKIIQQSLTQEYLQYEAIQKLNPNAQKILIPVSGVVPLVNLGE